MNAEEAFEISQRQKNFGYGAEQTRGNMSNTATGNPVPASPYLAAYNDLNQSIVELGIGIDHLRNKLGPILGAERPTADGHSNPQDGSASSLVATIRQDVDRIKSLQRNVADLLDRIEL